MATRRKQPGQAKKPAKRKRSPNKARRPAADAKPAGFVRIELRGMQQLSDTSLLRLLRRSCQHAVDLRSGRKPRRVQAALDGKTPCDDEACTLLEQITLPDGTSVRIYDCNGAIMIYLVT